MILLGIMREALLYICFSILIGSFFLSLVPEAYRPTIHVKKGLLMMAASEIGMKETYGEFPANAIGELKMADISGDIPTNFSKLGKNY